ncbi:hypothetical protein TEA_001338 [Camellia sinensis var. sinensis]|uniref:Coiled-coil domain-containing protein 47 n=1 Tax=Camellia sinensis var. sinensis TaxID=542762 RepID=A0A4S4DEA3_CAMSN|nr:hypothetical protein TEA_001338 [Camellia sinensis var. sinensis]
MAANRHSSLSFSSSLCSVVFLPRGDSLIYLVALLSIFSLLVHHLSLADSHFEGFDLDDSDETLEDDSLQLPHLPRRSPPPTLSHSDPEPDPDSHPIPIQSSLDSDLPPKPSKTSFEYWDEDEFEGLPVEQTLETPKSTENVTPVGSDSDSESKLDQKPVKAKQSFVVEIVCGSFLIMFGINFFTGKRENENIALAWVTKFAVKDSIFEKNFSLLGVGDSKDEDSPLLLKEGQNVFKFYASGRRFCQGLLATMELQSRHDLISRLFNMVVPCKDEITFEVFMNDDAMDQVVFALAKKKAAKTMQKEVRDLQRFASLVSPPSNRKWVVDDLAVISESKEVAGDLITEVVLEQASVSLLLHANPLEEKLTAWFIQPLTSLGACKYILNMSIYTHMYILIRYKVFGDKAFEKYGKGFISMHFSDQYVGAHKKKLVFKFALPDANHMADMTRLVALVPHYVDLIGRHKLSSQARSKTEAARQKAAQEAYKEYQNARQEALQKKKADQRKLMEEAEAKLSAEALRKKEAKERARQMKKSMPKVKMTRGH